MTPNYAELTRFLMEPLLDTPEDLKVYCEVLGGGSKVWVRVALEGDNDRGRFFGRGGRNIQAIRNILKAAGQNAEQQVTLEVFGSGPEREDSGQGSSRRSPEQGSRHREKPSKPRPKPKLKTASDQNPNDG